MNSLPSFPKYSQASSASDDCGLTILFAEGDKRLTKVLHAAREDDQGFDNVMYYQHDRLPFDTTEQLFSILSELAPVQSIGAVVGRVLPEFEDAQPIRRTIHGEDAFFNKSGTHRILVLDMDTIPPHLWDDLDLTTDAEILADRLRATFPKYLAKASCVVQLSSGYGRPNPKMRLYYVLDRAVPGPKLKALMRICGADPALASEVQMIYIANPVCVGIDDPVPARWFCLDGSPAVTLPPDDDPVWAYVDVPEHVSYRLKGQTLTRPVTARQGWRGWLDAAGSEELNGSFYPALRTGIAAWFGQYGPDADRTALYAEISTVIDRFAGARGARGVDERVRAVIAMIEWTEHRERETAPVAGDAVLISGQPTPGALIAMPQDSRVGNGITPEARYLDLRGTGAGKTTSAMATAEMFIDLWRDSDGERVFYLGPNHRLAREAAQMPEWVPAIHWLGLSQKTADGNPMCVRSGTDVEAALAGGGSVASVCGSGANLCPRSGNCLTQTQRADTDAMAYNSAVVVMAGDASLTNGPPKQTRGARMRGRDAELPQASLLIVDEFDWTSFMVKTRVTGDDLMRLTSVNAPAGLEAYALIHLSAHRAAQRLRGGTEILNSGEEDVVRAAAQEVLDALSNDRLDRLRVTGALEVARLIKKLKINIEPFSKRANAGAEELVWVMARDLAKKSDRTDAEPAVIELADRYAHNSLILRTARLFEIIAQSQDDKHKHRHRRMLGLEKVATKQGIFLDGIMRAPIWVGWSRVPMLMIDATAEPEIVRQWIRNPMITKDVGMRPFPVHHTIRQVVDTAMPYARLKKGSKWVRRFRDMIYHAAEEHAGKRQFGDYDVAVGLPKRLKTLIGDVPSNVCLITYGTESGLNVVEGCAHMLIISRPLPPAGEVTRIAEIIWGQAIDLQEYEWVRADRMTWSADGTIIHLKGSDADGSKVPRHPDWRVEMVRKQLCDTRVEQLIGRARLGMPRRAPVSVDIITNVPLKIPVGEFIGIGDIEACFDRSDVRLSAAWIRPKGDRQKQIEAALTGRVSHIDEGQENGSDLKIRLRTASQTLNEDRAVLRGETTESSSGAFAEAISAKIGAKRAGLKGAVTPDSLYFNSYSKGNRALGHNVVSNILKKAALEPKLRLWWSVRVKLHAEAKTAILDVGANPNATEEEIRKRLEMVAGFTFAEFKILGRAKVQ